jgi:hypothetical protein
MTGTHLLQRFLAQLVGTTGTLAAFGSHAQLCPQVTHARGTVFYRLTDLAVGYRIAQADIHGKNLE